jgi:TolA-binding protein
MTTRPNVDDRDEAWPDELRAELDALGARHRADPASAVLRAAAADALPPELQAPVAAGLAASRWQQTIVRGAIEAGEQAGVDEETAARMLARVRREGDAGGDAARGVPADERPARRAIGWGLVGVAAAIALLVVRIALRSPVTPAPPVSSSSSPNASNASNASGASGAAPAAPVFVLALEPAPVKLTANALVMRSATRQASLVDDAAPAFDAYRGGDYATAADAFARLAPRYPAAVELRFYLGVSRLLAGDAAAAAAALRTARAIGDPAFADDIAWYLAVAGERAGDRAAARAELDALCRGTSAHAARACAASAALTSQ